MRKEENNQSLCNPDYWIEKAIYDFIVNGVDEEKCQTVLDYGAGNLPYKKIIKSKNYISVDIEQNKRENIDYVIVPHTPVPVENNSIDTVLCMDVLEHSEDPKYILEDLYRILKNDGNILISIPFLYREHEMPHDFARYTSAAAEKLCVDAGFTNIKTRKIGNWVFVVYSLINERHIKYGECCSRFGLIQKVITKLFNYTLLPVMNRYVFSRPTEKDESIYHHLLISALK